MADNDAEAFYNFGVALDDKGDLAGARDAFARAVTINTRHNLAWNNLDSTRSRLDDEDGALAAYLEAAEVDPHHAEAQNNIAAIYIDRGEFDEARERLRLAIDAKPDFLEAHQNLSTLTKYKADEQVLCSHPRIHGAGEIKDLRAALHPGPAAACTAHHRPCGPGVGPCLKFYENRRPVRTASVAQVRQPIYSSSVARWQAYGDGLKALRDIVDDSYPHGLLE